MDNLLDMGMVESITVLPETNKIFAEIVVDLANPRPTKWAILCQAGREYSVTCYDSRALHEFDALLWRETRTMSDEPDSSVIKVELRFMNVTAHKTGAL